MRQHFRKRKLRAASLTNFSAAIVGLSVRCCQLCQEERQKNSIKCETLQQISILLSCNLLPNVEAGIPLNFADTSGGSSAYLMTCQDGTIVYMRKIGIFFTRDVLNTDNSLGCFVIYRLVVDCCILN